MFFLYYFWILIVSPYISFAVSSVSSPSLLYSFYTVFSFASICFVLIILLLPLIINNHVNICFWLISSLTNIFLRGFLFSSFSLCLWFTCCRSLTTVVSLVYSLHSLHSVCVFVCICVPFLLCWFYFVCSITSLLVNLVLFSFWSVSLFRDFGIVTILQSGKWVEMESDKRACSATLVNIYASCSFFLFLAGHSYP